MSPLQGACRLRGVCWRHPLCVLQRSELRAVSTTQGGGATWNCFNSQGQDLNQPLALANPLQHRMVGVKAHVGDAAPRTRPLPWSRAEHLSIAALCPAHACTAQTLHKPIW